MATIEQLHPTPVAEPDPEIQYLSIDDAGPKLDALSSKTAQSILVELNRDPATPTELADRVDTSVQNAGYHLSQLEDAGLVTIVGTRYSEKGHEMSVYASAVAALVISEPTSADGQT